MRIVLRRTAHQRHTLEIIRDDGTREQEELDTKTFLIHDLLHYAVESEADIDTGFWGTLARGVTLASLGDREAVAKSPYTPAMEIIEVIVGSFTSVIQQKTAPEDLIEGLVKLLKARGNTVPAWLTVDFLAMVTVRMRQLIGHWNSLEIGETLELDW